ncbi:MAG: hypothetical protein PHG05_04750 [Candidatus Nanoarchaeia archaeon]|nr:hypothetical protein [Candidatus Nanoarchaeia archaeon]
MEKKRNIFILSSVFFVALILFGVYVVNVLADLDTTNTTVTLVGGEGEVNNATKSEENETMVVTIVHDGTGEAIETFNITWDVNNYTLLAYVNSTYDGTELLPDSTKNLSNITWDSTGLIQLDWNCINFTTTKEQILSCSSNETGYDPLMANGNTTLKLYINVSGVVNAGESFSTISILTSSVSGDINQSNVSVMVDGIAPRISIINITDGNMTWGNNTSGFVLNGTLVVDGKSDITVYFTLTDPLIDSAWLNYSNGSTAEAADSATAARTDATIIKTTDGLAYATIPVAALVEGNNISFTIWAKDSIGNTINYTNLEPLPFCAVVNSTDVVKITNVNISDGTNFREFMSNTAATKYFLPSQNIKISVTATGPNKQDSMYIYYGDFTNNATQVSEVDYETVNYTNNVTGTNLDGTMIYEVVLPSGIWNISNVSKFLITVNSTGSDAGLLEGYTARFVDTFTIDGTQPTAEITAPADTSIEVQNSITYTCDGTDTESGVATYTWKLTKPDSNTVSKDSTLVSGKQSVTWTTTDTNIAGNYIVSCMVKDNVGNSKEATSTFSVSYTSGGTGGGGGGGSSTTQTTFDVDLSQVESQTVTAASGSARTFSFDGSTSHSIKVDKIEGQLVTFVISSNPITLTMSVGEVKKVDINDDGLNDMEVKVENIENSVVKYSLKKISEGATALVQEETQGTTEPTTEEVPIEGIPEESSSLWLWIILGVVVIAAVVFFVVRSRK